MIPFEKFDLVVSAIMEAKKGGGPNCSCIELVPNAKNKLNRLGLFDIEEVLDHLQKRNILLADISFPSQDTDDASEVIKVTILEKFNNFYTQFLLRKNIRLEDLTYTNLEKLYNLAHMIYEKHQLRPSKTVFIPGCHLINYFDVYTLRDALLFLYNKKAIENYEPEKFIKYQIPDITVCLNTQKFDQFYEALKKLYNSKKRNPAEKPASLKNNVESEGKDSSSQEKPIYQIEYTDAGEILLNNILLARVNFDSENENVFEYIFNNPNKKITLKEIEEHMEGNRIKKNIHKILENLGFIKVIKKAFFHVSKGALIFHNPLFQKDLEKRGIEKIRFSKD